MEKTDINTSPLEGEIGKPGINPFIPIGLSLIGAVFAYLQQPVICLIFITGGVVMTVLRVKQLLRQQKNM